jgi:hypothetical protein
MQGPYAQSWHKKELIKIPGFAPSRYLYWIWTAILEPIYLLITLDWGNKRFWNNLGLEDVFFMSGKTCSSKGQDNLLMLLGIRDNFLFPDTVESL